jgi:uncharacterized protein YggE
MRYITTILLVLMALPLFAKEPLYIYDSITLHSDVTPDNMISNTHVQYMSDDYAKATMEMEKFTSIVKSYDKFCSFNSYQVAPNYRYIKGGQKLEGYTGSININCAFDKIKTYENIINEVYTLSKGDTSYRISTSPVRWELSDKTYSDTMATLKVDSIKESEKLASKYSGTTGKSCSVESISMTSQRAYPPTPAQPKGRALAMAESMHITQPDQSSKTVNHTSSVVIRCD